jgi:hypothetical protein
MAINIDLLLEDKINKDKERDREIKAKLLMKEE